MSTPETTEPAAPPTVYQSLLQAAHTITDIHARVLVEDEHGWEYEAVRAFLIGGDTDDPGLVIKVRRHRDHS